MQAAAWTIALAALGTLVAFLKFLADRRQGLWAENRALRKEVAELTEKNSELHAKCNVQDGKITRLEIVQDAYRALQANYKDVLLGAARKEALHLLLEAAGGRETQNDDSEENTCR